MDGAPETPCIADIDIICIRLHDIEKSSTK